MKGNPPRLITASEIGRYLFCARALAYDTRYPSERDMSWLAQLRRIILSPLRASLFALSVAVLYLIGGLQLSLVAVLVALLLIWLGRLIWKRLRQSNSIIIYHGTRAFRNHQTLVASEFGLSGKPDYLLVTEDAYIPVLTKNNPAPDSPHDAHIMQLIAYCLLVAEDSGQHPPYGVLRYGDGRTFEIDFDEDAVEVLSRIMDELEKSLKKDDVPLNHADRGRCYACSQRKHCDQSLF